MASFKSAGAFGHNIKFLANNTEQMYFWTFTFPVVLHPKDGALKWQGLCRELRRSVGFRGVRVFELHPNGHGLHVHVATPDFYDVNLVRNISNRHGFGRLNVKRWCMNDIEQAAQYMGKYLMKSVKSWGGVSLKGMRWWDVFGMDDKIRVKDVWVESTRRKIWDVLDYTLVCLLANFQSSVAEGSKKYLMAKMEIVNAVYFDKYDTSCCGSSMAFMIERLRLYCFSLFEWSPSPEVVPI